MWPQQLMMWPQQLLMRPQQAEQANFYSRQVRMVLLMVIVSV